jgi:hypothetical protein
MRYNVVYHRVLLYKKTLYPRFTQHADKHVKSAEYPKLLGYGDGLLCLKWCRFGFDIGLFT